jgi:hypothetical protein
MNMSNIRTIDVTKQVLGALTRAGYGDDSNQATDITKAGIFDLMDSLVGKGRFTKDDARAELHRRGL